MTAVPEARGGAGRKLLLLALGVCLGIVAAEGILRAAGVRPYPIWSPRDLHVADPELGLMPAPSFACREESAEYSVAIRTNSLGLRSPEPPADPGFVVFVLGDSFAFGRGVEQEETAPARLQRILDAARGSAGRPITVLNLGVESYGTWQSLRRFDRIAPRIAPDLCVLLFFAGNDVLDNVRPALTVREGFVVREGEAVPMWRRLWLWLKFHSASYRAIADALPATGIPGRCSDHTSFGFDLFRRAPTAEVESGWRSTEEALSALRASTERAGCRLVVACIPTRFQVDPELWRRDREECGFAEEDFDLERVSARLSSACAALEVPCLDLLPAFRRAQGPLYFHGELEMHLDAEGQRVLAQTLAEFLASEDLLK
jgi:lysophospholipase L1-like esterase